MTNSRENSTGYKKLVIKNISWVWSTRVLTRLVSIVRTAITARILSPSAFGIFGVASIGLASLEILTETGINVFLIQEKNSHNYISSAWVVSIFRGMLISFLLIVTAPLFASFFKSSDAYVYILVLSVVPFIKGFINPSIVLFQKNLVLHKEFWYRSVIFFLESLFTVIFTFYTKSPAGLVAGLIGGAVVELLISHIFVSPRPIFELNSIKFRKIIHSGKWVTIYGIFNFFSEELDNAVVARMLGVSALGIYDIAYRFSYLPISEVSDVVSRVIFPVYTKIADEKDRLISVFIRSTVIISFFVISVGIFLFLFSDQIIILVLGDKWSMAIPILKVLVLYGVVRGIIGPFSALFLAMGKQNFVAAMTASRVSVLAISIVPLIMFFGIYGAAYSVILSSAIEAPVAAFCAYKLLMK